jgi:hypothetical protein
MQQTSTVFITVEYFGEEGEVSAVEPENYSLKNILPEAPLFDVRDEVVERILLYAKSILSSSSLHNI